MPRPFRRPVPVVALAAGLVGVALVAAPLSPPLRAARQEPDKAAPPAKKVDSEAGIVLYNPANGHYYQSFGTSLTWEKAALEATKRSYKGTKGHLVTITSQAEYDFLVKNLWVYDYWIGGYRHPERLRQPPTYGWSWVTGEPWGFTAWNDNTPSDKDPVPHGASFWTGSMKWSPHVPTDHAAGYVVEYPVPESARPEKPLTSGGEIDAFLNKTLRRYARLTSYQARIEFTSKAWIDTIDAVRADLVMRSDGRFRLEGRGENGKVLAISDGRRLMLAVTEPGARMKFVVKPMPRLPVALRQAFSLLTSSPKPPSITGLIAGAADPRLYSGDAKIGEFREEEGKPPTQAFRSNVRIRTLGEDPMDGNTTLLVELDRMLVIESELGFRFKAYPYSVKERHTDVRINEAIPDEAFVLVITRNAVQVDDLGEDDEPEMSFSVPPAKK